MSYVQGSYGVHRAPSINGCAQYWMPSPQLPMAHRSEALLMCRDHILNIKEAPAPKPAGKGAKRTLEQATAAPPATAAASAAPPQEASAAAQPPVEAPAVEAEQPSDGQDLKEQPAAQEQTLLDAAELQLPGLAQESAQAGSSEPQADGDAAASTTTVSVLFSECVGPIWLQPFVVQHAMSLSALHATLQGLQVHRASCTGES